MAEADARGDVCSVGWRLRVREEAGQAGVYDGSRAICTGSTRALR